VLVIALSSAAFALGAALATLPFLLKFAVPQLIGANFRGRLAPAVGGIFLATVFALTEMVFTGAYLVLADHSGSIFGSIRTVFESSEHAVVVIAVFGFFALGLIDDLAGHTQAKGLRGHFRALSKGVVTGGAIKAVGGMGVAFIIAVLVAASIPMILADTLIIALSANVVNLLDLRPGRSCKAFAVGWVCLAPVSTGGVYPALTSALAAAVAVWMPADLHEKAMLGDSGSNLLGAVLGVGVVLLTSDGTSLSILAILVAVTLASEKYSFTTIISKTPPLRWFDALGRSPE